MESVAIIDLGSQILKAGVPYNFPTDGEPSIVIPARVVGSLSGSHDDKGAEIPVINRGIITHWDGLEALLYHALYKQLGWREGDEGFLMMPEALFVPKADRERLTQLAFEKFDVAGLFLAEQSILSLYSVGKTTGLVVDFGHGKTDIAPVIDGQLYYPAARRLHCGGQDLTEFLKRLLLQQRSDTSYREASFGALGRLKEECITIAESPEAATSAEVVSSHHELGEGQQVSIGREALQLGEAMLDASVIGIDEPPVSEAIFGAVSSHPDPAVRKALLENILVCGGGSGAAGLGPRLLHEIKSIAPPSAQPGLCAVPEYMPEHTLRAAAWMGGAVLSKVVFAQNHHVSKNDYDEAGPAVVHRKCFA